MRVKDAQRNQPAISFIFFCLFTVSAILLHVQESAISAPALKTAAEIALYQGPDRETILIEGAKKEGTLTLYTSNASMANTLPAAFEKKYPFIKIQVGRADSQSLIKRLTEEHAAGRYSCDVIETSDAPILILHREGFFQEYYTPEAAAYRDDVKKKGKTGVYYLADREVYDGLGFNIEAVTPAAAPKELKDLLDPKWKGKMSIVGSSTGIRWLGSLLDSMGRDYLERLSRQEIKVQNITAAALATLVVSGEVPLSPCVGENNINEAKKKGAPVEWRPIGLTPATTGLSGMIVKAPHPHAALLYLDFLHSKEGQQIVIKSEEFSPRTDLAKERTDLKKDYVGLKYPVDEYETRYNEWQNLLKQLFIQKR
jgi:iron(III) transport system substrate-binding protein